MDYISQRIKSMPPKRAGAELHRRIMNRAFYLQFRWPITILIVLGVLGLLVDSWHVLSHSVREVFSVLVDDFEWNAVAFQKAGRGFADKALLHIDLIVSLLLDAALIIWVVYVLRSMALNRNLKRSRGTNLNTPWLKSFSRCAKALKDITWGIFPKKVG